MSNSNMGEQPNGVKGLSPRHTAALDLARSGVPVAPIAHGTKDHYLVPSWKDDCSRDEAVIMGWIKEHGDCNFAMVLGNKVDPKTGEPDPRFAVDLDNAAAIKRYATLGETPDTWTQRTAGGGQHRVYKGQARNTNGTVLGPYIDTRGSENGKVGYIMAPGSQVFGRYLAKEGRPLFVADQLYTYEVTRPIAAQPAPEWLKAKLSRARRDTAHPATGTPVSAEKLREVLALIDPSNRDIWRNTVWGIHGTAITGGDEAGTIRRAIAHEYSRGALCGKEPVSYKGEDPVDDIFDSYDPNAGGEFGPAGFGSIFKLAQEAGYKGDPYKTNEETFGHFKDQAPKEEPAKTGHPWYMPSSFTSEDNALEPVDIEAYEDAAHAAPPLRMLVDGVEADIVVLLSGPGGTHKSRLTKQLALAKRYGRQWLIPGHGVGEADRSVPVVHTEYLNYENAYHETHRRVQAMRNRLRLKPEQQRGTMKVWELRKDRTPMVIVPEGAALRVTPFGVRILERLRAIKGHKLLVLDSFFNAIDFRGGSKNDDQKAGDVIVLLDHWCEVLDATIVSPFHPSRSGASRGDIGHSPVFEDRARQVFTIEHMKAPDLVELTLRKWNNGKQGISWVMRYDEGVLVTEGQSGSFNASGTNTAVEIAISCLKQSHKLSRGPDAKTEKGALLMQGTGRVDGKWRKPGAVNTWVLDHFKQAVGKTGTLAQLRATLDQAVAWNMLTYDQGGHGSGHATGYGPSGIAPLQQVDDPYIEPESKHPWME